MRSTWTSPKKQLVHETFYDEEKRFSSSGNKFHSSELFSHLYFLSFVWSANLSIWAAVLPYLISSWQSHKQDLQSWSGPTVTHRGLNLDSCGVFDKASGWQNSWQWVKILPCLSPLPSVSLFLPRLPHLLKGLEVFLYQITSCLNCSWEIWDGREQILPSQLWSSSLARTIGYDVQTAATSKICKSKHKEILYAPIIFVAAEADVILVESHPQPQVKYQLLNCQGKEILVRVSMNYLLLRLKKWSVDLSFESWNSNSMLISTYFITINSNIS